MKTELNCPWCDTPAMQKPRSNRVFEYDTIYTQRECPVGHTFWSVEFIPDDQDAIEEMIKDLRRARRRKSKENYLSKFLESRSD